MQTEQLLDATLNLLRGRTAQREADAKVGARAHLNERPVTGRRKDALDGQLWVI